MPSKISVIARAAASDEMPTGGTCACVRIGAVLHPSMLHAFADSAGLLSTEIAQPRSVRIVDGPSLSFSIKMTPARKKPGTVAMVPAADIPNRQSCRAEACAVYSFATCANALSSTT